MYLDILKLKRDQAKKEKDVESIVIQPHEIDPKEGVWFFVEHRDGKAEEESFKIALESQNLAIALKRQSTAIITGNQISGIPAELGAYGTDNAFLIEDNIVATYSGETYVELFVQLISLYKPSIIIFSASAVGNDLAPRLAARMKTGFIARYNEISIDNQGNVQATRAIHGSHAQTSVSVLKKPLIATIDAETLSLQKSKTPKKTQSLEPQLRLPAKSGKTTFVDYLRADPCTVCVSEAEIVIGIGKGLSSVANLPAVEELARTLGASIGGSRRATDEHWIADERRIGLTGKTISPRLYLICGISGAFHHTLSITNSKYKIAINKDPNAPITKLADLMVVGDMQEVIPELTKQLHQKISPK